MGVNSGYDPHGGQCHLVKVSTGATPRNMPGRGEAPSSECTNFG